MTRGLGQIVGLSLDAAVAVYASIKTLDTEIDSRKALIDNALLDIQTATHALTELEKKRSGLSAELDRLAPPDFMQPKPAPAQPMPMAMAETQCASPPPQPGSKPWHRQSVAPRRSYTLSAPSPFPPAPAPYGEERF